MKRKPLTWIAWVIAGTITLFSLYEFGRALLLARGAAGNPFERASDLAWLIFPIFFAIPGALIVSRQPRNAIGWLMLIPSLSVRLSPSAGSILNVSTPPASPSLSFLVQLWFDNWSWTAVIFPNLLIPLLFPTGRPPTPRWRWVIYYTIAKATVFILLVTFSETLSPLNYPFTWSVENPIGWISNQAAFGTFFSLFWPFSLAGLTLICVAAPFFRYRRAGDVERAQIRWFLYACVIFGSVYSVSGLVFSDRTDPIADLWNLFFTLSLFTLPLAIAIAILRHRLYDIDIIIRKTLVYTLLTGLLALTYFGSIVSLQGLFSLVIGGQSPVAVVISTLLIAAMFSPLRARVQTFIDRRFFRQKYDAEKLLAAFARRTRDETDLDALTADLLSVVAGTMHPTAASLWMMAKPPSSPAGQAKRA